MYPESYDCGLPGHLAVMRAAMMEPGVHTMSDELILQISCNIFLAFKWISMITSGQNISHYTTAKLSVHVWNHGLIWWQNKIDTQKHFHKTTITSSWTLSKTKIPITIVKAQMPSNPNQKSRIRDNNKVQKCLPYSGEFLAFNDTSDYHWESFTAGDPVPDSAIAIGQLHGGTPLYIVHNTFRGPPPFDLTGYYNPITAESYFVNSGVVTLSRVNILLLN